MRSNAYYPTWIQILNINIICVILHWHFMAVARFRQGGRSPIGSGCLSARYKSVKYTEKIKKGWPV